MQKTVGINERGRRVGESHPKARLTDHEVDLLFELYEQGLTIMEIARKFELRKSTVNDILKGRRRTEHAVRGKTVRITN
jgi:DNA-binding NarL/FixJ family response regulator